ncbi:MAG TPA: Gfo/Idh/MocA family oxidoreductase [Gammaproteobacteria bacterium]|nr:Gfo/Idh/MocA family oxidoreductase [Gammaproteobacteria bacterium]
MNMRPLNVLIIGCGNIAGAFDEHRSLNDLPVTHAGAFYRDERFNIIACVDPDYQRRSVFMNRWDVASGFLSIDEVAGSHDVFDIISICSPTESHIHDLETAIQLSPKVIFCEKPISTSLFDAERLVNKCKESGISLAINYTRRWDPDMLKLKADIQSDRYGQLRSIVGIYNKGILNNGSHMLDLLHMLIGSVEVVKAGSPVDDFFLDDPTIPMWLEGRKKLPIHLVCGHADDYSIFEVKFIFSSGVLTMEEGGMFWREQHVVDSDVFKGYQKLDNGEQKKGKYPYSMVCAVDNIYRSIYEDASLASTGESALAAQRLCEKIKHLACN